MATTNAIIPTSTLNGIANAIIAKDSGGSMTAAQMATRIANIPTSLNLDDIYGDEYLNDGNTHWWIIAPVDGYVFTANSFSAHYDWGDGNEEDVVATIAYTHTYTTAGIYRIDISNITNVPQGCGLFSVAAELDYPQYINSRFQPYFSCLYPSRLELSLPNSLMTASSLVSILLSNVGVVVLNVHGKFNAGSVYPAYFMKRLVRIDAIDLSESTNNTSLFNRCLSLAKLPDSLDLRASTSNEHMFYMTYALTQVPQNLQANKSISFSYCGGVSKASVSTMIANINTCTNSGQSLTFSTTTRNLFTSVEWAALADTLSAKNWGLSPAS